MAEQLFKTSKIAPAAYNALGEALAIIFWNIKPFEGFIKASLRGYPEIIGQLSFTGSTKRETSSLLIEILSNDEEKYRSLTLELMVSIADMDSFPNLNLQEDSKGLILKARISVNELKKWVAKSDELIREDASKIELRKSYTANARTQRLFALSHQELKSTFMKLYSHDNPQQRGRDLETLLNTLFQLYDLLPRKAFRMLGEQIDGSFSFDTDDYTLEAKWLASVASTADLTKFDGNIKRKGANALGLFFSLNGFSKEAVQVHNQHVSFIGMDGGDLLAVLEQKIRLDDLLAAKKRHVNETGNFFYPVSSILVD